MHQKKCCSYGLTVTQMLTHYAGNTPPPPPMCMYVEKVPLMCWQQRIHRITRCHHFSQREGTPEATASLSQDRARCCI